MHERVTVLGAGEVPLAPQGQDYAVPVDRLELHGATPVCDRPAAAGHDPEVLVMPCHRGAQTSVAWGVALLRCPMEGDGPMGRSAALVVESQRSHSGSSDPVSSPMWCSPSLMISWERRCSSSSVND